MRPGYHGRMTRTTPAAERDQTWGEELANAISHGIGCLLAVASLPVLVRASAQRGGAANVVGASLFAATMILLYLVSALYHALPPGRAKHWFNRLDHAAIYLFIAGSYMPFAFGVLHGAWGWTLFGLVWAAAVLGVAAKLFNRLRHPLWSTGLYVAMGWVALVAGGLAYTLGAIVFLFDSKLRYAHFVWHLFVMAGSTLHFLAALWHAVGAPPMA